MENLERFDERTGIVKLKYHKDNEEYYVVYFYLMDLPRLSEVELGMALSKGKTTNEAYKKAIIKLTKKIIEMQQNIDDLQEKIHEFIRHFPREGDEEIVIGERLTETRWNNELQTHEYFEGKEVNADIGVDDQGEIFSCTF